MFLCTYLVSVTSYFLRLRHHHVFLPHDSILNSLCFVFVLYINEYLYALYPLTSALKVVGVGCSLCQRWRGKAGGTPGTNCKFILGPRRKIKKYNHPYSHVDNRVPIHVFGLRKKPERSTFKIVGHIPSVAVAEVDRQLGTWLANVTVASSQRSLATECPNIMYRHSATIKGAWPGQIAQTQTNRK